MPAMNDEDRTEALVNDGADEAAVGAGSDAEARVEALEAEVAGLKDQLLRTLAEMENLRRRTEREIADTRSYGAAAFARDVLSVGDNLARALAALPDEAREGADAAVTALLEGVEITERELLKTLEKHGVRKIEPVGEKFDPNFHQAMFEVPNSEVPSGTVVQVVQSGYKIGDRVLRPAMVGVGRGGPKAAPAVPAPGDSGEETGKTNGEAAEDAATDRTA